MQIWDAIGRRLAARFRRSAAILAVGAFLPLLTGCLQTVPMWEDASRDYFDKPHAFGILNAPPEDGGRQLLVAYERKYLCNCGEVGGAVLAIPLQDNVAPPYAYEGSYPTKGDAVIDAQQRLAVQSQPTQVFDATWARRISKGPSFQSCGTNWYSDSVDVDDVSIVTFQANRAAVVPRTIPRPRSVIRSDRLRAALLTPVTVLSDALVLPLFGVFMIFGAP